MLDVAAVAEAILELEPASTHQHLAKQFGLIAEAAPRWLAALVGLHDVGKATPGFQAKWPEGRALVEAEGLPFASRLLICDRHDWSSAAILEQWLPARCSASRYWCRQVAQAVSAHHGYPLHQKEKEKGLPARDDSAWQVARHQLLETYWGLLFPLGKVSAEELDLAEVNWLAGLTSIADWIGSNPEWFPLGERNDDLVDYYCHAKSLAHQALTAIGWRSFAPLLRDPLPIEQQLGRMLGATGAISPRPLQSQGMALLQEVCGPALLLVEAPMGEGKTELAFLAHLQLQQANSHRGFYLALPTQATGNALFERARQFLHAFAEELAPELQLIHGGAARREMMTALNEVWGETGKRREGIEAARWFSRRRRPLIAPYGVGTIDQALFSVLNVKHHFVRLWGLANRVVVLDEVHAYDAYTEGLIEALLRWLKYLGCSVVLMSATLPAQRRNALLRAWQVDPSELPVLDYPRLLLADGRGICWDDKISSRPLAPIRLAGTDATLASLQATALEALVEGGCGAIIVNTVERAQQLFELIREQAPADVTLQLFHARFPADERAERETAVLSTFGKQGDRPARALLVATQVVEQSLDIDFDFLVSDLAPVDLLLQRAGRLHRHERSHRPAAHCQPVLTVAGLLPGDLPDFTTTSWRFVYDPYLLAMTWAQLLEEETLHLPKDIDRLVQQVYTEAELPPGIDEALRQYIEERSYAEHLTALKEKRQRACNIAIEVDDEPARAYQGKPRGHEEGEGEDMGLINCTRLGKPSIGVIPLFVTGEGVSLTVNGEAFSLESPLPPALSCRLCERQISISNQGLVHAIKAQPVPPAFADSPLLRYGYPLLLDAEGKAQLDGGLSVRLDRELGLIYERNR
jgi:CRISPR-associated endonuclease/helicase Cas3